MTCSTCYHWRRHWPQRHKDGYLEAMCEEPADLRDREMKRGSDRCSKWKAAVKAVELPDYGF
jgi:hypothetical protein